MLLPLIESRPVASEGDSGFGIRTRRVTDAPIVIRTASARDADAIHELIDEHLTEGHLLRRELGEILVHAHRFVVAAQDDEVLGCAELAPLSNAVAEVRSMVVTREARGCGVGRRIVDELVRRAIVAGFRQALRLHPFARVLRPPRVLDRAARVAP
jgi:GNAT superfamily N-acetyltransferase